MVELSLCESLSEFPPELFAELDGPDVYPFLRREWLLAFEETGCLGAPRGWIPRHVAVRRGRDLIALAPAYVKLDSYGEFVFDHAWAEFSERRLGRPYYPKLIFAVPFTPATGSRILFKKGTSPQEREEVFDLVTGAVPEIADKLGLSSVHFLFPEDSTAKELRDRSWTERLGLQFQFHREQLETFEDFLGTFKAKRRAAIRRECREISRLQIDVEVTNGPTLRCDDADLAYRLYLTTVDKYFFGRRYLTRAFFRRVMSSMPDGIHFVVARDQHAKVLGGAFNLLGKEALYGRYWGAFEEVPFLHFNVCLYRGVEECLKRRLQRFEPGAGGAHKEGRGFAPTTTRSLHYLKDATLAAAVSDFCRREAEAVVQHVER